MVNFNEERHEYSNETGDIVPSVTGIIEIINPEAKKWYTEESRQRGTAVHRACELYDKGSLDFDKLHPVIKPYVRGYITFCQKFEPEWEEVEKRFISELGFAGTYDRLGKLKGAGKVLADIKTGENALAGLQLAGYKIGNMETLDAKRAVILLNKDGGFKLTLLPPSEEQEDIKVFLSCLNIMKYKMKRRIK